MGYVYTSPPMEEAQYIDQLKRYYVLSNNPDKEVTHELENGNLMAIRHMDLSYGNINSRDIRFISLGFMWRLMTLNLNNNPIGDEGAYHLANGNLISLRYLYMQKTSLTDNGAISLATGNLTMIEILDLGVNYFTEKAVTAIFTENLTHLKSVRFSTNFLTIEGKEALKIFMKSHKALYPSSKLRHGSKKVQDDDIGKEKENPEKEKAK